MLPVANFSYTGSPYCQNAVNPSPTFSGGGEAGIFSSNPVAGLSLDTNNGIVNLALSTAGTYTVTNTIAAANGCGAVTSNASITITIAPKQPAISYNGRFCSSITEIQRKTKTGDNGGV